MSIIEDFSEKLKSVFNKLDPLGENEINERFYNFHELRKQILFMANNLVKQVEDECLECSKRGICVYDKTFIICKKDIIVDLPTWLSYNEKLKQEFLDGFWLVYEINEIFKVDKYKKPFFIKVINLTGEQQFELKVSAKWSKE